MIRLLLVLHPRSWRNRYGEEFRALLEDRPLTAATVLDVLRNAIGQHARAHAAARRLMAALVLSAAVDVVAVRGHVTDNILWPPTSLVRALALAALLLPWMPVVTSLIEALRRRRTSTDFPL